MPMISYAQNREDVLLNRVFPEPTGFYIDVGAALPVEMSVTKHFYDRGWQGINVEPQDVFYRALKLQRPRDFNLQVVVSAKSGSVTLYEAPGYEGLSTINADAAKQLELAGRTLVPRTVPALTLAEICERHAPSQIDFLKIDAEGEERNVLLGADFSRWRPRVLVIEATEPNSPVQNHHLWEELVLAADYKFATFDGLNRYYVRVEDEALIDKLQLPVNVFDDFIPFETDFWRKAAETNERNVVALHAECDRIRTSYDTLLAAHKDLWDRTTQMAQKLEATERHMEIAQQKLSSPPARPGLIPRMLTRLWSGWRRSAHSAPPAVVVSQRVADDRSRVLTTVHHR